MGSTAGCVVQGGISHVITTSSRMYSNISQIILKYKKKKKKMRVTGIKINLTLQNPWEYITDM